MIGNPWPVYRLHRVQVLIRLAPAEWHLPHPEENFPTPGMDRRSAVFVGGFVAVSSIPGLRQPLHLGFDPLLDAGVQLLRRQILRRDGLAHTHGDDTGTLDESIAPPERTGV